MQEIEFIFGIAILIMSVVAHELSHGYAAEALGDPTARLAGRLTINPLKHLDPIGSVIVPTLSFWLGGFIFGWAKPVPYNPYNLSPRRAGEIVVAAAGAFTNIVLALIFGMLIRFGADALPVPFVDLAATVVFINIILAFFNLIPIPPLDGSKVLFGLLPFRFHAVQEFLERYALLLLLVFAFFLWQFFLPFVLFLFSFVTGVSF